MDELGFWITWITGVVVGLLIIILFLGKIDSIKSGSVLVKKEVLIKNNLAEYDKDTGEFILKIGGDK